MTNDLISRSALLSKAIRVTEADEGGWERTLRAVPVEDIEAAEAVNLRVVRQVIKEMKQIAEAFENETYYTGYVVALSTLEGRLAEMETK